MNAYLCEVVQDDIEDEAESPPVKRKKIDS